VSEPCPPFDVHRPTLVALAYQLLGDLERADDIVHEAWLHCELGALGPRASRSDLLDLVGRLCRRGEPAGDRDGAELRPALDRVFIPLVSLLRKDIAACRRALIAPRERRDLLSALSCAGERGDLGGLRALFTPDATLFASAGSEPRVLRGLDRVAPVAAALLRDRPAVDVARRERDLGDEPAVEVLRDQKAFATLLVSVAGAAIRELFVHVDALR
jgi:RNA polymerase sigma-70 factor (ECF subfamily)